MGTSPLERVDVNQISPTHQRVKKASQHMTRCIQATAKPRSRAAAWIAAALAIGMLLGTGRAKTVADENQPNVSVTELPVELIVVQGAAGAAEYESTFAESVSRWCDLADRMLWTCRVVAPGAGPESDRERLQSVLQAAAAEQDGPLWLVLIGHGTFTQNVAKFNLEGPDVSAQELASWLNEIQRPVAVINCASCSGAFIGPLSGPDRVVVTATRSGAEQNFSRFGGFLSEAIHDPQIDLDHDGSLSLLEAFLASARRTQDFYRAESRLATEHALLDDNGDRAGTSVDFFRGIRAVAQAADDRAVDGLRAHQWMLNRFSDDAPLPPDRQQRRAELEQSIETLRAEKAALSEENYYERLESLLVEFARLYQTE